MSKLSRFRRKVFRHRLVHNDTFENIKVCVKACPRSINVSTLAYYWKYAVRRDPERSASDWRLQMQCRRWENKHRMRSYPNGISEWVLQARSMRTRPETFPIWPNTKKFSELYEASFTEGNRPKLIILDSLQSLRSQ